MRGERGWRELATMGDTTDQLYGRIEGFIWHKNHYEKHQAENKEQIDDWIPEKVYIHPGMHVMYFTESVFLRSKN